MGCGLPCLAAFDWAGLLPAPPIGRVHTGGERFFGVNGDVTSFGRVTP